MARRWSGEVFVLHVSAARVLFLRIDFHFVARKGRGGGGGGGGVGGDFAKGGAALASAGRRKGLAIADVAAKFGGCAGGSDGLEGGEFGWQDRVFEPPFSERALVKVQPVLLRAYDHAGTHESHVRDDLVGREAMAVDEVCAD